MRPIYVGICVVKKWIKKGLIIETIAILAVVSFVYGQHKHWVYTLGSGAAVSGSPTASPSVSPKPTPKFIRWVDFNISYEALCMAYDIDIESRKTKKPISWIELLAYVGAKNGGKFCGPALRDMEETKNAIAAGKTTLKDLAQKIKSYSYYFECYDAVLHEYIGKDGLQVFSPIAKGFPYSDFDDFGVSRGYGYQRKHLGHDMMGQIGTPIIAVEGGTIEALGWNQYGGWRIGIRSNDKKRYYYYAHLRQKLPYNSKLKEGGKVKAGEVIGYMGHTGYSTKEDTNNIDMVHLHFGVQLIFDESQKEGNGEIWIDCYALTRFLSKNRRAVEKIEGAKEWREVSEEKKDEKKSSE